jgi:hypothetical protein
MYIIVIIFKFNHDMYCIICDKAISLASLCEVYALFNATLGRNGKPNLASFVSQMVCQMPELNMDSLGGLYVQK